MLKNWHKQLMILLFIGIVANTLMNKILPIAIIGDEFFHFPQIILFKSSSGSLILCSAPILILYLMVSSSLYF